MEALMGLAMVAFVVIGPIVWINWWVSTYDDRHWAERNTMTVVFPNCTSALLQGTMVREDGREVAIQRGDFFDIYELLSHNQDTQTVYVGQFIKTDPAATQQMSGQLLKNKSQAKFYEKLNRRT